MDYAKLSVKPFTLQLLQLQCFILWVQSAENMGSSAVQFYSDVSKLAYC